MSESICYAIANIVGIAALAGSITGTAIKLKWLQVVSIIVAFCNFAFLGYISAAF